jgi:phosphohistidine phosphatase
MWLYLVQHGQAKTEEEDPERPLTDRGAADVGRVAEVAARVRGAGSGRFPAASTKVSSPGSS